jgi:NADPH-dependent glutamate synthase beta subunit-like oxidoreductase
MLAVGIPEYRLPRDILDYEIDVIKKAGVEIRTNTERIMMQYLQQQELIPD